MSDSTGIQWTEATWNPTTGCDRVSPGCDRCYAMAMAARLKKMGSAKYWRDGDPRTSGPGFGMAMHLGTLDQPLHWRRPRRIFVNSMSDLFHAGVSEPFIGSVWNTMALAPQHTFQILTKRHARMKSVLTGWQRAGWMWRRDDMLWCGPLPGPLPNVHLGVSAEDQHWANLRIPALLHTPAAVRFLSCEPLLGPLDLRGHLNGWCPEHDFPGGFCVQREHPGVQHIGWVIVGGESGRDARPMDVEWARSLVRQCRQAGVPVFVKQLGSAWAREHGGDSHGADWSLWPEDLRVREFPAAIEVAASA